MLDDSQEAIEAGEGGESRSRIEQGLCDRSAELVYASERGECAQGSRPRDGMSEDDEDEFGRESREASRAALTSVHLGGSCARQSALRCSMHAVKLAAKWRQLPA